MNHHPIQPTAEPAGRDSNTVRDKDAAAFRSLALQLRRWSHEYRTMSREAAARGNHATAARFRDTAQQKIADAIWYWRRAHREAVQFNTEDAS